jgi:hypothetical protein
VGIVTAPSVCYHMLCTSRRDAVTHSLETMPHQRRYASHRRSDEANHCLNTLSSVLGCVLIKLGTPETVSN